MEPPGPSASIAGMSDSARSLKETADEYLQTRAETLSATSMRGYEGTLRELAAAFPKAARRQFEPPGGTATLRQLLSDRWGGLAPATYNKNLSVIQNFFRWCAR